MIRLAANISTMFQELPFLERIDAAAEAGFAAVECQFPYAVAPEEIARRLQHNTLRCVLFNSPPGQCGKRRTRHRLAARAGNGISTPGWKPPCEYIEALDCRRVHVMAGLLPAGADRAAAPGSVHRQHRRAPPTAWRRWARK